MESTGILEKTSDGTSYTTFDNTWCTSKIWNDKLFNEFWFYPTLNSTKFPFRTANKIEDLTEDTQSGFLAFDTNGQLKCSIPNLLQLEKTFSSEFDGLFIRKAYFWRNCRIPKNIHQVWIGDKPAPMTFISTWKNMNPLWKHTLWNEDKLRDEFPEAFNHPAYINAQSHYARVDILRLFILNKI